jgi:hypothetical protein
MEVWKTQGSNGILPYGTEDLEGKPGPRGWLRKKGTADQIILN